MIPRESLTLAREASPLAELLRLLWLVLLASILAGELQAKKEESSLPALHSFRPFGRCLSSREEGSLTFAFPASLSPRTDSTRRSLDWHSHVAMTILPAPAARGPAASTSQLSPSESHPLKEQRRRLLEVQNQITQIDRTKTQLQLLLPLKGEGNSRRLSSSSEASSWSIASTSSKGSVASEIKGRELLLPLSSVAFVAATISATYGAGDEEEESPSIFVRKNVSTTGGDSVEGLVLFDEARSGAVKEDYEELSVASAIARLEEQRQSESS